MKNSFEEIVQEINWSDGFRIPIANDENKHLEKEVEEKATKKRKLADELEITRHRIEMIDQHVENIVIERDYNQNLLSAYISQHDAEDNLHKISKNEIAVLSQEIRDIEKEKKSTLERIKFMEAEISKLKKKLNSSKAVVALDETKCLQLAETLNCEEERQKLIEKYLKIDGKKFKELDLKRQKLEAELQHSNQLMAKMVEEVIEKEIVLDRTAKFYTQVLEERRHLIDRWTQSIVVLRQRDSCIQTIFREIKSLKEVRMEKLKLLAESVEFMDNQKNCNKQLQDNILKAEKKLTMLKDGRLKMAADDETHDVEHKIRQQTLNELSYKTESLRNEIKGLKEFNAKKRSNINDCNKRISDSKKTLRNISDDELTLEDRINQLKLMFESEEKRKHTIMRETKKFQDLYYRTTTQITEMENERKTIELQKRGALRQIELVSTLQSKQMKILQEKKDVMHQLDLKIRDYELQVANYNEETDNTELERNKHIIKELENTLNEKKEVAKLVQSQIVNLDTEMKKIQTAMNRADQELEALRNKHKNLSLMMEGSEKKLKNAVKLNEERQVAKNILELRVTQVEELMRNTGTKVHNLERCHLQIQAAMKERMTEIKILREALNSKYRLAHNECSHFRIAIADKQSQTLNYQTRYDSVMAASRIHNADRVIPTSSIHLKIQNAKNKDLLQERGDQLDVTIRRTEQEIKSMENTLRVVNACNEKYKMSFVTDDTDNDENSKQIIQQQLCAELSNTRDIMKQKELELKNMEKELLVTVEKHKKTIDTLEELQEDKEKKHQDLSLLEKQITDQKGRISRADMRLKKLYKDIQRLCERGNSENILLQEKDIRRREFEEINLLGLQRITEFTVRHVEAEIYVKKLITSKNIVLPGIQHLKSTLSLSICDDSVASSVASFSPGNKAKLSMEKL